MQGSVRELGPRDEQALAVFDEITQVGIFSRISSIAFLPRSGILALGDSRYCKNKRRAEAIMSALRVVEWYENCKSVISESETFVLGLYPLTFVLKLSQEIGAWLFSSRYWSLMEEVDDTSSLGHSHAHYLKSLVEPMTGNIQKLLRIRGQGSEMDISVFEKDIAEVVGRLRFGPRFLKEDDSRKSNSV